jgi:hypothetical protein
MAYTRPSGLPLVPDSDALVTQEIAEIDGKGRFHLLPRWTKRTNWPPFPAAGNFEALMVLTEPGRLSLMPWEPEGSRAMERYRQLSASEDGPDLEALRILQDRYRRLVVPNERRPYLGDAALQHLGLPTRRGRPSNVYVAILPDRIDLLGPSYRDGRNEEGHPSLDGLP